jgi:hypothetical protein
MFPYIFHRLTHMNWKKKIFLCIMLFFALFAYVAHQDRYQYLSASIFSDDAFSEELSLEALNEFYDGTADDFLSFDLDQLSTLSEDEFFEDELPELLLYHSNGELVSWAIFYKLLYEKLNQDTSLAVSEGFWYEAYEDWFYAEYPEYLYQDASNPVDIDTVLLLYGELLPGSLLKESDSLFTEELLRDGSEGFSQSIHDLDDQSFNTLVEDGYSLDDILSFPIESSDFVDDVSTEDQEFSLLELESIEQSVEVLFDELIDDNTSLNADTYELLYGLEPINNPLFSEIGDLVDVDESEVLEQETLSIADHFEDLADILSDF